MQPEHFLDLGRQLSKRDDAAACRTAISRAYYAAYHVAAKMLKDCIGVSIPSAASGHAIVQDYLTRCGDLKVAEIVLHDSMT